MRDCRQQISDLTGAIFLLTIACQCIRFKGAGKLTLAHLVSHIAWKLCGFSAVARLLLKGDMCPQVQELVWRERQFPHLLLFSLVFSVHT